MRKSRPKGSLTQDYTAAGPVPDSVLYSLFDTAQVDYLLTNPLSFLLRDVLNFLRSGDLPPRERVRAVYKEAQYYAIGPLLEQLENMQPLKGEKVRQAFLGLMPYYKGEGSAVQGSQGVGKEAARHLSVLSSPPDQVYYSG